MIPHSLSRLSHSPHMWHCPRMRMNVSVSSFSWKDFSLTLQCSLHSWIKEWAYLVDWAGFSWLCFTSRCWISIGTNFEAWLRKTEQVIKLPLGNQCSLRRRGKNHPALHGTMCGTPGSTRTDSKRRVESQSKTDQREQIGGQTSSRSGRLNGKIGGVSNPDLRWFTENESPASIVFRICYFHRPGTEITTTPIHAMWDGGAILSIGTDRLWLSASQYLSLFSVHWLSNLRW